MSAAETYSAARATVDGVEVVRLNDPAHRAEVAIIPSIGNMAYEFKLGGANAFYWPYHSLAEFKAKPGFAGNPFLAPWANRLDEDAFYANGHRYALNPSLGNIRRDQFQHPIHGFLSYEPWDVVEVKADADAAWVTSRLEFWKHPAWMAQFPFAHVLTMTYRLSGGVLETKLSVQNLSTEPMPLAIGFHPYFQIHDASREDWTVHVAARERVTLSPQLIPTGEMQPSRVADPQALRGTQLDDVFAGLQRPDDNTAVFWVKGAKQRINVIYGPKYNTAVVYAPPGREFICFEPMTGITNAMNLAHKGLYKELQYIQPGATWTESFWVRPEGF